MMLLDVKPGEEVMEALTRRAAEHGLTDGAIVSLIGAVDAATISNMPADDPRSDVITDYRQPCELSGTGEITAGKVHIHVILGREGDIPVSGHLHAAQVETIFVHAYVLPLQTPKHCIRPAVTAPTLPDPARPTTEPAGDPPGRPDHPDDDPPRTRLGVGRVWVAAALTAGTARTVPGRTRRPDTCPSRPHRQD